MAKLKHIIFVFCSLLFLVLNFNIVKSYAAPAVASVINIEQPNGAAFDANLHGDEWSNWTTETAANNIIVQDGDSYWKYARISYGKLVPSEAKVGIDPVPQDTVKSDEWVNVLSNFSEKSEVPKTYYASGDAPQSAVPIQPAGAPQKIVVLLVSFTDVSIQNTDGAWSNNFFGDTGKTVKTYYKENSQGSFYFAPATETAGTANDGIIRVTLNYAHPNTGATTGDANRNIVKNALIAADPYINFASYDTNGNGYIEANELHIVTIVAGYERSCGAVTPNVWGHRWALFGSVPAPQLDGKYVAASGYGGYTQQGELHASGSVHMATIGILCHELGHDLGLFDEYDTVTGSYVVGVSSVMDGGSWGAASSNYAGSSPTSMDPYSKIYLGFANPLVMTSGQQAMNAVASGGYNIVKVPTQNANQYFLVENRNLTSFDIGLQYGGITNGGIAIWHINEDSISAYKFADTVNNSGHDPGVWLEKTGTPWDPYYRNGGVMDLFADTTTPNSKLYDGTVTNIKIKALDPTGTPLRIQIGDATGVGFAANAYSVNENAGSVSLTVTRTSTSGALTLDYTTSNGSATAGADYTATTGTLSFADGEASKTILVPILDDTIYEGNETFTVTLSNPSAGTIGTAVATVTIVDNDPIPSQVGFSSATFTRDGEDGPVVVTVNRTGSTTGTLTVDYITTDGTAIAGSDYTSASGTITFASGETSKIISISLIRDGECEAKEDFTIKLSNPSSGSLSTSTATCTIIDEDIIFSPVTYSVEEGKSVKLRAIRGTATIDQYRFFNTSMIGGTATAYVDFPVTSAAMNFLPGETETTTDIFCVYTYDDSIVEPDETCYVILINASYKGGSIDVPAYATSPYNTKATITIIDNDVPSPKIDFYPATYTTAENSGSVTVTVTRSEVTTGTVTVDYTTADGTAAANNDYTAVSGTLTFNDGETTKTIIIPVLDDNIYEGNEAFTVNLSNPSTGNIITPTAAVNITDNEAPPIINFNPVNYTIAENGVSVTMAVYRTGNTTGSVSVNYKTVNGTALAGSDYTAQNGTLTFADGETYMPVVINIKDDAIYENSESFNVILSNPVGGILGSNSTAIVTITDDDSTGGTPAGLIKTAKPLISSGSLGKCAVGETQQMTIIATFENGVSMDITALATWKSEYTSVATVDKGLITGVARGMTNISFTYNGQTFSFLYAVK